MQFKIHPPSEIVDVKILKNHRFKQCPDCPWSLKIARGLAKKKLCLHDLLAAPGETHDHNNL